MDQTTKMPMDSKAPKGMKVGDGKSFMRDGMKKRSPSATDSSTVPPSGSVNDGAVRSGVGRTHSIGGRVA